MLDLSESGSSKDSSNFKATKSPLQVYIHDTISNSLVWLFAIVLFIYQCVGFGVARFDELGMPEPRKVGRVTRELPTLFVYVYLFVSFRELRDTILI